MENNKLYTTWKYCSEPSSMDDKIIPRNYPSISHLPGSKLIDYKDTYLGMSEVNALTKERRSTDDIVIVTEKVDGMNVGVYRKNDKLYPLMRHGYDVRSHFTPFAQMFANFVEDNAERFFNVLEDGERLCGEWMIKTHTIPYKIKGEPFLVFDIIKENTKRYPYTEFIGKIRKGDFTPTQLIHMGLPVSTSSLSPLLNTSFHGGLQGLEGFVYKYENKTHGYLFGGKYVSHPFVGNEEIFRKHMDDPLKYYNDVAKRYRKYIPNKL